MLKKILLLKLATLVIAICIYSSVEGAEQPIAAIASSIEGPEYEAANSCEKIT